MHDLIETWKELLCLLHGEGTVRWQKGMRGAGCRYGMSSDRCAVSSLMGLSFP